MRMKVLTALLVIALMLSGMPLTAKAASSTELTLVCPTESYGSVKMHTIISTSGTAKYGDNDIVVIIEGDLQYSGNLSLKVNSSEKKTKALNRQDYVTSTNGYKTAVVFSPNTGGLSTGDKISLYFECIDTDTDGSKAISMTAYQKASSSDNNKKFDGIYRVEINNYLADGGATAPIPYNEGDEDVNYDDEVVAIDDYDDEEVEAISSDVEVGARAVIDESSIKQHRNGFSAEIANESGKQTLWEITNVGTGKTTTKKSYCYEAFDDVYKSGRAVVKVRAHFIEGNTAWSDPVYVVPCATFDSMKKSYVKKDRLTLKWDKVAGATGYEVCMASDYSKNYKKIATTKSTSKTIKVNLKSKSRQFVVRAVYKGQVADEKAGTVQYYSVKYI